MYNVKNLIKFLKTVSANIDVIKRNMTGVESFIMKQELEYIKERIEKAINVLSEDLIIARETEPTITEAVLTYQENIVQSAYRTAKEAGEIVGNNLDHIISIVENAGDGEGIPEHMHEEMKALKDWCNWKIFYMFPKSEKTEQEYDE